MGDWIQIGITIIGSVVASSGFWAYIQKRNDSKSASTQLLLGLAHDRIIALGLKYLERGWLTKDEYEDFEKYLYGPYSTFGGNGLAMKMKTEIDKLPIRNWRSNTTGGIPLPSEVFKENKEG